MGSTVPYWRLSAFYFFYFGSLGAFLPYWGLYLQTLGFQAQAIGQLVALLMAIKIIAPNVWGELAARTGQPMRLIRVSSLLAALFFMGALIGDSYLELVLITITFGFFWNAALPLFETITLAHLGSKTEYYGQIRLWGSIGFILTVVLFGWLFEYISIRLLPILLLSWFSSIWLSTLLVPSKATTSHLITPTSFFHVLKQSKVIALFLACLLMQLSHGPYYTFYSIHLEAQDYSRYIIGLLWALGVVAEVGAFLMMHYLLNQFSLRYLLILSLGLTGFRWLMIGYFSDSLVVLLLAQLIHAASFGTYHGVAMQLIRQYFTDHHLGRAQALYNSLSFGVGGALGSLMSGYVWEIFGAHLTFLWAAIICGIAVWTSWQWLKD